MSQPVSLSAVEALCNVGLGFTAGLILQSMLHTAYGIPSTAPEQISIVLAFTLASLVRSFALRRLFERFRQ